MKYETHYLNIKIKLYSLFIIILINFEYIIDFYFYFFS